MLSTSQLGEIRKKSIRIPQEDCEWNENPFPYISETYGTKNYTYEKFFTPAARLLFYLIVYIIGEVPKWLKGTPCFKRLNIFLLWIQIN